MLGVFQPDDIMSALLSMLSNFFYGGVENQQQHPKALAEGKMVWC